MSLAVGLYERAEVRLSWAAATETGKVRPHNEDGFLADAGLFVVADGMGGHEAGEVASSIVVDLCWEHLDHVPLTLEQVVDLVDAANGAVFGHAAEVGPAGMGTTLVGIAVVNNSGAEALGLFHVGDSRAYGWSPDTGLEQLTRDHSMVQELIDAGRIDEDDAAAHPGRNVVTRAIGIEPTVVGDIVLLPTGRDVRYLLCSDGVSGQLTPDRLAAIVGTGPPEQVVDGLLAAVLEGPAPDNATAIVIDVAYLRGDRDIDETVEITRRLPWRPNRASSVAVGTPQLDDPMPVSSPEVQP